MCVYCIWAVFVPICRKFKNINLEKIILVLRKKHYRTNTLFYYLLIRSFLKLLFVPSQRINRLKKLLLHPFYQITMRFSPLFFRLKEKKVHLWLSFPEFMIARVNCGNMCFFFLVFATERREWLRSTVCVCVCVYRMRSYGWELPLLVVESYYF